MNTSLVLQLLEVSYLSCGFTVNANCSKAALAAKRSDPPSAVPSLLFLSPCCSLPLCDEWMGEQLKINITRVKSDRSFYLDQCHDMFHHVAA